VAPRRLPRRSAGDPKQGGREGYVPKPPRGGLPRRRAGTGLSQRAIRSAASRAKWRIRAEERWWNCGKNWFPSQRVWHRWSDPTDADRWLAVVYYGYPEQKVYAKLKKGF